MNIKGFSAYIILFVVSIVFTAFILANEAFASYFFFGFATKGYLIFTIIDTFIAIVMALVASKLFKITFISSLITIVAAGIFYYVSMFVIAKYFLPYFQEINYINANKRSDQAASNISSSIKILDIKYEVKESSAGKYEFTATINADIGSRFDIPSLEKSINLYINDVKLGASPIDPNYQNNYTIIQGCDFFNINHAQITDVDYNIGLNFGYSAGKHTIKYKWFIDSSRGSECSIDKIKNLAGSDVYIRDSNSKLIEKVRIDTITEIK